MYLIFIHSRAPLEFSIIKLDLTLKKVDRHMDPPDHEIKAVMDAWRTHRFYKENYNLFGAFFLILLILRKPELTEKLSYTNRLKELCLYCIDMAVAEPSLTPEPELNNLSRSSKFICSIS